MDGHPTAEPAGTPPPKAAPPRRLGRFLRRRLPAIVLEAASVVFAVLLALAVDEWREDRGNRALARRAQGAVLAEIRANRQELFGSLSENGSAMGSLAAQARALEAGGGRSGTVNVGFEFAQLSSAAWRTSQATQAAHFLDYGWLIRMARLYDLQEVYVAQQTAVLDDLGRAGGDPLATVRSLQARMELLQTLGDSLLVAYSTASRATGAGASP